MCIVVGLNIFYSEEKDWVRQAAAYNATMPSPGEVFTKEPNHTHTYMHTHTSKNRMFDNTKRSNN